MAIFTGTENSTFSLSKWHPRDLENAQKWPLFWAGIKENLVKMPYFRCFPELPFGFVFSQKTSKWGHAFLKTNKWGHAFLKTTEWAIPFSTITKWGYALYHKNMNEASLFSSKNMNGTLLISLNLRVATEALARPCREPVQRRRRGRDQGSAIGRDQ